MSALAPGRDRNIGKPPGHDVQNLSGDCGVHITGGSVTRPKRIRSGIGRPSAAAGPAAIPVLMWAGP